MMVAEEIARRLLQINAIKLNPQSPFTWASGILSPIYCDNRITLSYPAVRAYIRQSLAKASEEMPPFEVVAGVATAGIAQGLLLAEERQLPFVYVRSKAKGHGRQNLIEGHLPEGSRVLVVEDLISTGGSSLQAVEALRAAGAEVVGVLAIFTYGFEQASRAFEAANCPLMTLSNYDVLIREAVEIGYIQESELNLLQSWRAKTGAV